MRNVLHLSSRSSSRPISESYMIAQPGRSSVGDGADDDEDGVSHLANEVCFSASIEIPLSASSAGPLPLVDGSKRVRGGNSFRDDSPEPDMRDTPKGLEDEQPADSVAPILKPVIVVIHPRAVFRDCFARCLEIAYDDHGVYSFASVADWRGSTDPLALAASIAIVVVESGDGSGLNDLQSFDGATGKTSFVVVSDIDDVDHIVRTLKRGARGYIPSSLPFNVAVEAVRLVEAGGIFVPASSFVDREQLAEPLKAGVTLTQRQMAVLEEIRHGKANKQIAYELKLSEHTVKVHLRHIMRKLNVRNRTEVAIVSRALLATDKE